MAIAMWLAASCGPCPRSVIERRILLEFGASPGESADGPPAPPPFVVDYQRLDLHGRLPAVVKTMPGGVPVTLSLWIRAGSDEEMDGEAGASHLARLALVDPATDPGASAALAEVRAAGGSFEARTSRRYTVITVRAPAKRLEAALRTLHPFVSPPAMQAGAVDRARTAAAREADSWWGSREERASDAVRSLLLGSGPSAALYPDLGLLAATGRPDVEAFVSRTYVSGGIVLGAGLPKGGEAALSTLPSPRDSAGTPAAAEAVPSQAAAPAGTAIAVRVLGPPEPTPAGGQGEGAAVAPVVAAGVLLPSMAGDSGAAARIAAEWLASDGPGTLTDHVSSCPDLVARPRVVVDLDPGGTMVTVIALVRPGSEARVAAAAASGLAIAATLPPGLPALKDASHAVTTSWMLGLQDPFAAAALLAGHAILAPAGPDPEEHLASLYGSGPAGAHDLLAGLSAGLAPAFAVALPPQADGGSGGDSLEEVTRAALECGASGPYAQAMGPAGARVAAFETAGKGRVAVAAYVAAGTLAEPEGREGTSRLLSLLLGRKLDDSLREVPGLDPDLVESSVVHEADRTGVIVEVPASRWREALDAALSALLHPALDDPAAFEAERQRCLALASADLDPGTLGLWMAVATLLGMQGEPHPEGTAGSLGTLSGPWLADFHAAASASGVAFAIAGDVDGREACRAAALSLHPWAASIDPGGPVSMLESPSPVVPPPKGFARQDRGSGTTASVAMAWAAPGDGDPDLLASMLLSEVLDERLREAVMEKKGLAIWIGSSSWATAGWGVLAVRAKAPSPNLAAIEKAVIAAIQSLQEDPPSAPELAEARERLLESRAEALALPGTAGPLLADALLSGEPLLVPGDLEAALDGMEGNRIAALAHAWLTASPAVASVAH